MTAVIRGSFRGCVWWHQDPDEDLPGLELWDLLLDQVKRVKPVKLV
jgi:hypothetical protein